MAPTKEKVSSNYIPDDIAFDILSKLPVKSLKRFSCVRKSWANLFENPQFMSIYRNNFIPKHDDDTSRVLLNRRMPIRIHDNLPGGLFRLSGEAFRNRVQLDWPPPIQEDDHPYVFILGSAVNGILCLSHGSGIGPSLEIVFKVVLWNPTTGEFNVIPPGFVDCPPSVGIWVDLYLYGFGYDPGTDDYKLIRVIYVFDSLHRRDVPVPEHFWQIYSLRSNSWRKLDIEMPSQCNTTQVYLNGVCHWLGFISKQPNEYPEQVVASFNLIDEVLHTTPFNTNEVNADKNIYINVVNRSRHLVVLKGSIAMITMHSHREADCFDISILGEVGVKESWTKLFFFGPLPNIDYPIGVGKKGDIFFKKSHPFNNGGLARFDLSSQMIEDDVDKGDYDFCQIVIYNESLLPIRGINS